MFEKRMFEETIFAESIVETSWAQRARRGWTTFTSFGLQALIIGLLLLLPLWRTVGLPSVRTISTPISAGRVAADPAPQPRTAGASALQTNIVPGRLMEPSRVPSIIRMGPDDSSPQPPGGLGRGIEGTGLPPGTGDGVPLTIIPGTRPMLPTPPASTVRPFRSSSLLAGSLLRRVQPIYPPMAKSARVQGPVVLVALISKAGTIENLRVVSGHPLLVPAAIDAVSQWRYRPYILNSEAIEVETQITVNFSLSGN
jgi:periplasmic protein TonB